MDARVLEKAGLSKGEAEVYLILLRIGEGAASEVAKHTHIARPNVYDYLNKLKEKSLVSFVRKNHKTHYVPASPERILDLLEEKKDLVKGVLPDLLGLYNPKGEMPQVEVYEGVQGFKLLMNDIVKTGKSFVGWGGSDRVREYLPEHYVHRYNHLKEKHNIQGKMLFVRTENVLNIPTTAFKEIPEEYTSPCTTVVYGEKVAIMIYTAMPVTIVVKSKELADSYRKHFHLLWKKVD